jgi:hypothetical protein
MLQFLKLNRVLLFFILATPWTINYFYKFADFDNYIILAVLGFVMLFIWFGLLNQELMKRIPKRVEISDTLFYINLFLMFLLISLFYILSNPDLTYHFNGIAALPFLYLIYAVFQIYNHLSRSSLLL